MRIINICYSLRDVESMRIVVFIGCSTQESSFETTLSIETTTTASHLTTTISSKVEGLTDSDIGLIAGVVLASVLILVASVYLIKSKLTRG